MPNVGYTRLPAKGAKVNCKQSIQTRGSSCNLTHDAMQLRPDLQHAIGPILLKRYKNTKTTTKDNVQVMSMLAKQ